MHLFSRAQYSTLSRTQYQPVAATALHKLQRPFPMNFELISILLLLHLQIKKESAELFALQNTDTRGTPRPQWTAAQWSTSGHVWGSGRAHGPQPARPGTSAVPTPQSPQSRGKCHTTTTSPFVPTNSSSPDAPHIPLSWGFRFRIARISSGLRIRTLLWHHRPFPIVLHESRD